tara:strand:- start:8523 stop:9302 length:780 start_codon:yes stop_codon:yes gene_type:complete
MKYRKASYIIRLDDASHFSNLSKWNMIENILDKNNILPTVAIIPDNEDIALKYSEFNSKFWDKVKNWENKGWTIAMHGNKHLFHKINRRKLIFPFYNRSEFGGLNINDQRQKIRSSINLFLKNNISPNVWIAPAHSFDRITMEAIKHETDIRIISDGVSFSPYYFKDFYFIPQQLWQVKKRYFGLWTICLHPDTMTNDEINDFDSAISSLSSSNKFIDINALKLTKRPRSLIDHLFALFFWTKYETKRILGYVKTDYNV